MKPDELIRVMEQEAQPLVGSLVGSFRTNLGVSHYRRLSDDDVFRRIQGVYQTLAQWLRSRDDAALQRTGEELGKRRFEENIPLGQVVLALILTEAHLWRYLKSRGTEPGEELRGAVTQFFQKTIYGAAQGFEAALAKSNRFAEAGGAISEVPAVPKPPGPSESQKPQELQISRGGEIGEHGG